VSGSLRGRRIWPALIAASASLFAIPFVAAALHAAPVAAGATPSPRYADGAPPGFSGGFKEESCHACHFEAEPNTRPGEVSMTGLPERFVAGQRYPLTIRLSRPGMVIGGFQLAARFDDGTQAGALERAPGEEKRVAVDVAGGIQYANQRRPGVEPAAPGTAQWTVVWMAPAAARPVTFYVAANAADNDESTRGDYVYTAVVESKPQ
jgi:hypothetical protein